MVPLPGFLGLFARFPGGAGSKVRTPGDKHTGCSEDQEQLKKLNELHGASSGRVSSVVSCSDRTAFIFHPPCRINPSRLCRISGS